VDKFAATGLTAGKAQHVCPPIIEECIAHLECRVVQEVEAGDHHLIIAEVLAAYTRPGVLADNGLYDLSRVHLLLHLGRNRFTSTLAQSIEPPLAKQSPSPKVEIASAKNRACSETSPHPSPLPNGARGHVPSPSQGEG
jgi:hypothetical protein